MSITKKEYFDVWEQVKSKFYQDTKLLAVSKNMERLAIEINKSYGEVIVHPKYLKNKLKLLNNGYFPHAKMSINTSIFNAMKTYGNSIATSNLPNEKEYIGRIDIIESWTKIPEVPSSKNRKSEIEKTPIKSVLDDDLDAVKLRDIVGIDAHTPIDRETITADEEPQPILPLSDKEIVKEKIPELEELTTALTLEIDESTISPELSSPIAGDELAPKHTVEEPILPILEELPQITPEVPALVQLLNYETPEVVTVEKEESAIYSKGLLLVSIIAILFFTAVCYQQFSTPQTVATQGVPSYLKDVPTAENTVKNFFEFINQKDYKQAFALTDNELWNPYAKFIKSDVWGGFEELSQPAMLAKDYSSKFGADEILEVSFYAFDIRKQENLFLKYDFHLTKKDRQFIIVRMVYPR